MTTPCEGESSVKYAMVNRVKRHQEDHKILKKANKGCKGHFRGQRVKKWKNIDFIAFL